MVCATEVSHFDSLQGQATFFLPKMCTPPPGHTKPTIQLVPGIKPPWHIADHSPASKIKVKKVWSEVCTPVYAIFDVHRNSCTVLPYFLIIFIVHLQ